VAALSVALAFAQSNDCDSLEKCQEVLKTNPKSSLARYRIGEIYFGQGNFQHAAVEGFLEATRGDREPKWTEIWSHVNLGRIYDLTNQRDRALNEYRIVLKLNDNSGGAVDQATQYIETPYKSQ
jgi:tetratricopeptide (TPR) repeat protein